MNAIWDIAEEHALHVVEDAAQSFGSEYQGRKCGTLGTVAAMSFYPTKNLGALGDAGLVTTADADIARRVKSLRVHGSEVKYYHKEIGYNMRLDAIHAAMLRVKLPHVAQWLNRRQEVARRYDKLIEAANLHGFMRRPLAKPDRRHTFNQYVVRVPTPHRDGLVKHMKENQVGVEVYYPLCLHEQECFRHLGYRAGDFPESEAAATGVLALPIFPEITEAQQARVIDVCAAYLKKSLRKAA
jgi:dTDP-4-amino-4,6-dideoxygalactose transaminase